MNKTRHRLNLIHSLVKLNNIRKMVDVECQSENINKFEISRITSNINIETSQSNIENDKIKNGLRNFDKNHFKK